MYSCSKRFENRSIKVGEFVAKSICSLLRKCWIKFIDVSTVEYDINIGQVLVREISLIWICLEWVCTLIGSISWLMTTMVSLRTLMFSASSFFLCDRQVVGRTKLATMPLYSRTMKKSRLTLHQNSSNQNTTVTRQLTVILRQAFLAVNWSWVYLCTDVDGKVIETIFMIAIVSFDTGVTSTIMNGFSQPASIQLPTGTWENGIFDYDDLMRSYVPSYTRYWDNQSQVPFLYNPGSTVWITYDDLQSVGLKTDYIKRKRLGGAMFWELSGDRGGQLVGATFLALNGGVHTSSSWIPRCMAQVTTTNDTTSNRTRSSTSSQQSGSSTLDWQPLTAYRVDDLVTYEKRTYRCIQAHTSLADWIPSAVPKIWQLDWTVSFYCISFFHSYSRSITL